MAAQPAQAWTLLEAEKCVRSGPCEDGDLPSRAPGVVADGEAKPYVGTCGDSSSSLSQAGFLGQGVRNLPLALRA